MTPFPDPVNGPFPSSPTEPDYPAAHSMDTTWYAVDAVGHVAMFITGENGQMPEAAGVARDFDEPMESFEAEPEVQGPGWEAAVPGFFGYAHNSYADPLTPYTRSAVPAVPVHVDQLPPTIRKTCRAVQFEGVVFSRAELVQPIEYGPCIFWGQPDAYVASDGKTVRPIPGREGNFAALVAHVRKLWRALAAKYVFKEPGDGQ